MAELKNRLKTDLVTALKAHDELAKSTIRMALASIANEEVAGKTARTLTDAEETAILNREVARRKDAAEAYAAGGRQELVDKELAEAVLLQAYLPQPLTAAEVQAIVDEEVAASAAALGERPTMKQMGGLIKAVNGRVAGRFEGGKVAAMVKAALA